MSYQVINPLIQFVDPVNGKPLSAGSVYFGRMDSDPKNQPSNRINVYAVQDNGSEVLLSQPIELNSAGQPQYSGSVKQIKIELYSGELAYSVQAFSRTGVQKAYTSRAYSLVDSKSLGESGSLTLIAGVSASEIINRINQLESASSGDVVYDGTDTVADTSAIQAILDAMPANHNLVLNGPILLDNTLTIKTDNFAIRVNGTVKAAANSDFEYMLYGSGRYRVAVVGGVFDANRLNRTSPKTIRRMCVGFSASTECGFIRVTATRAEGHNNIPGVGIAVAGASLRGYVLDCLAQDCGGSSGTNAADGCFTSGTQNIINNLVGNNCTDTLAVIESSDYSIMNNITGYNCACVAAITNASSDHKRGNIMSNVTGINWKASNTGGIQIGCPAETTGNLVDTLVSNIDMYAEVGLGFGVGAAVNIRQVGFGKASGVTINGVRVNGATTQGILCDGDDINVQNGAIKNTSDGCVQFQTGASGEVVNMRLTGGAFGVIAQGTAQVASKINTIKSSSTAGIAAYGTSTIDSVMDINKATTKTYKEAGATINAVGYNSGSLVVNDALSAVPAGADVGGEPVYNADGTIKGYITIKAL